MNKLMNKEKNNKRSENRTETLQVKVSPNELEEMKRRAKEAGFGGKISPYIRNQILHPCAASSAGKLQQKIATMLCMHAQLIEATDDPELRLKYAEWEGLVWQFIRS